MGKEFYLYSFYESLNNPDQINCGTFLKIQRDFSLIAPTVVEHRDFKLYGPIKNCVGGARWWWQWLTCWLAKQIDGNVNNRIRIPIGGDKSRMCFATDWCWEDGVWGKINCLRNGLEKIQYCMLPNKIRLWKLMKFTPISDQSNNKSSDMIDPYELPF